MAVINSNELAAAAEAAAEAAEGALKFIHNLTSSTYWVAFKLFVAKTTTTSSSRRRRRRRRRRKRKSER